MGNLKNIKELAECLASRCMSEEYCEFLVVNKCPFTTEDHFCVTFDGDKTVTVEDWENVIRILIEEK